MGQTGPGATAGTALCSWRGSACTTTRLTVGRCALGHGHRPWGHSRERRAFETRGTGGQCSESYRGQPWKGCLWSLEGHTANTDGLGPDLPFWFLLFYFFPYLPFLVFIFKLINYFIKFLGFFWPCIVACGISAPGPGIEPGPWAERLQSPNHCTARELSLSGV